MIWNFDHPFPIHASKLNGKRSRQRNVLHRSRKKSKFYYRSRACIEAAFEVLIDVIEIWNKYVGQINAESPNEPDEENDETKLLKTMNERFLSYRQLELLLN